MAGIPLAKMSDLQTKADKTYVDEELNKKADKDYVDNELSNKADITQLNQKADKAYVDEELSKKADAQHNHTVSDITDFPSIPTKISELSNDAGYIDGSYDNSNSGLNATTLQEAIDELKALIDSMTTQE